MPPLPPMTVVDGQEGISRSAFVLWWTTELTPAWADCNGRIRFLTDVANARR